VSLLGDVLPGPSWHPWRILLIAAMGEALDDDERVIFRKITGREREPLERCEELWVLSDAEEENLALLPRLLGVLRRLRVSCSDRIAACRLVLGAEC
jgi:hypothetical protein